MQIHCKYDELVNPKTLLDHPKNRNKHSPEQIERLAKILEYQGWRYAIKLSNLSGFITTGHGRKLSALLKEWEKVPVVYQDYDSEDQEYADVQSDNAIASWADLDLAGINLDVPELGPDFDIDLLGIKDFVIEPADKYGDQDADAVPEQRPTDIKLGDLFSLGTHRLLCGDSTDRNMVERLLNGERADMVYTDPPYGISFDDESNSEKQLLHTGRVSTKFGKIIGDGDEFDPSHILDKFKDCEKIFLWGANEYAWKLPRGAWIVWDKKLDQQANVPYGDFELCWSKTVGFKMIRCVWGGFKNKEAGEVRLHPTQKPVQLAIEFFERWGKDKVNIVDLYLGSGTTLIACEKTQRRCFGMEIDPQYCQVIIDRWEKFTGLKAVKL